MLDLNKIGTTLLIIGVLAWAPFIYLVAEGQEPSIFPFLAVHLTGVIGGTRLRAMARGDAAKKPARRSVLGRIMIIVGVLAWSPFIYQRDILGRTIEIGPFLVIHLTGVLGGITLIASTRLGSAWRKSRGNSYSEESLGG